MILHIYKYTQVFQHVYDMPAVLSLRPSRPILKRVQFHKRGYNNYRYLGVRSNGSSTRQQSKNQVAHRTYMTIAKDMGDKCVCILSLLGSRLALYFYYFFCKERWWSYINKNGRMLLECTVIISCLNLFKRLILCKYWQYYIHIKFKQVFTIIVERIWCCKVLKEKLRITWTWLIFKQWKCFTIH